MNRWIVSINTEVLIEIFDQRGFLSSAGDRYDSSDSRSRWDDDWDKSKGQFPFSEKLGEISDKIGSTIDDTISRFRKKDRDDSPDRFRLVTNQNFFFVKYM